ncbi:aminotransferase class I/II-fold pyridoxal phosphate-dependent enzyme [Bifidobacterium sp. SMB2]|uniref:Aminotransferase n=1 Tax=Bifidobacterium saimiriisciurei TaxID=2661627 RepID=A0ABX0C645_9BIFI|nr:MULTISPECIES: aminotransferase class I/II-fold pyridoxal phosphate-dependent enzyme [Bifidobacterium]NEG96479.1 aminotransferase class I/II-fold pyridoxal phosphate-dependent enzyme [Bifidobacterium sp. SMB2]NEH10604.1 aminotransferase class I/II-fold pyridoxal phosphate-dependent enzyme [Bifidobacterium saimiriisciurei]NEH10613.1 aminotransferase class I/II-fold pyridoxal phosphate-dependent enzyme [Bifidobacterium saimiriisciurei]
MLAADSNVRSCPVPFAPIAESIPPNVFAVTDRKVAKAVASGADVIDLAKGNPDAYPAEFIRAVAKKAVDDPANARYTPFDGKPAFLEAAAEWYRNVHGVELDWPTQLFAVEGAVDGLAGLYAILIDRGDAVAFVDPYYPSYHCMAVMHGAEEILLPALADHGFLPDLDAVTADTWDRVKMLVLNYPNNPTGAQASLEFLRRAVELAREHRFVIVHDYAYTGLGVGGPDAQQHSILEIPGAFDVAVEVCSLSKMYAMAGWRAGFVAGNEAVVSRLKLYHYQMGSMITGSIQDAGIAALLSDQSCVAELAERYAARRRIVAEGLREAGLDVFDSAGGIYVWAHVPRDGGWNGERLADHLLDHAAVAVLPGTCFGHVGADYIRLSLLKSEPELAEAVRRIQIALR